MIRLREQFADHDAQSQQMISEMFQFKNKKSPYLIYDVNYWLFGELPENIPDGYFEDGSDMMDYQIAKIRRHYETLDDCYEGFLMPWFGTGVLASAFGIDVGFNPKMDPAVMMAKIKHPDEIYALKMPNPQKDGLMPSVLRKIESFKNNCDLPIGVTDCQGPLTSALSVVGYENYIYWMYDHPEAIHHLMNLVTDALIEWVRAQKRVIGVEDSEPGYVLGVHLPKGSGGAWLSDDDNMIFSEGLYRDFVVPYNSKFLKAFGGGAIHYCGNAVQHKENYVKTEGLTCLHNFHLDDYEGAEITRNRMREAGIPYVICDFTPSDSRIGSYYEEMFSKLDQTGMAVVSYIAPATELNRGKYLNASRDAQKLSLLVREVIEEKQKKYF